MSIVALAAVSVAGVSCLQLEQPVLFENLSGDEIVFVTDAHIEAETKASSGTTETTSLTSFYVSAVTGSAGSESSAFGSTQFTQVTGSSPATYKGSKVWPTSNQNYKFYASNRPLTFAAAGTTVSATNTTDVVCAYLTNGTYKAKNTLTFEHIFARFGRVDVVAESGYTISNISIRITPKTGGTYNLRTGAGKTDGTGWSSVTTGSATVVANATGANANDIYLVPGTYELMVTWTATQSGTSITYTDKVVSVSIVGGKTNVVSIVLGGEILFGVDLVEYGEYNYLDNLDYLTFYCDEAGTIGWKASNSAFTKTIQYSKNQGASWTSLTSTTSGATISVSAGDIVWFKGSNSSYCTSTWYYNYFTLTNKAHVYGNVNSLTGDNTSVVAYCFCGLFSSCGGNLYTYAEKKIILPATTLAESCYNSMFTGCTSLTTAPELPATTLAESCYNSMFSYCTSLKLVPDLPATTLAGNCYGAMFSSCTSLTTASELPATTLASNCYTNMFEGCTSLTTAPSLSATTLANSCYYSMFYGCTSLKLAPELPATTLATGCYQNMFFGCTSLKFTPELPATMLAINCYAQMFAGCTSLRLAPELPATTLASNCYNSMFSGCTSLTTAPDLPATTLASNCYRNMFYGCSSLNYIKAMFKTTPSDSYTQNWVSGVAATGTFVKNGSATWDVTGNNGVPTGWTVVSYISPVGEFTINASGDKVGFSPGNLQCTISGGPVNNYIYTGSDWCFAENQWDYLGTTDNANKFVIGKKMDLFGWVGESASYDSYGLCYYDGTNNVYYGTSADDGLKTDWGEIPGFVENYGTGWFTLSREEWVYIFNTRNSGTVGGTPNARYTLARIRTDVTRVNGIILFPDNCSVDASEFTTLGAINGISNFGTYCTAAEWDALAAKGCVFLPAAGYRYVKNAYTVNSYCKYWAATAVNATNAREVIYDTSQINPEYGDGRRNGESVRLVKRLN